jgi:hypothetical protein
VTKARWIERAFVLSEMSLADCLFLVCGLIVLVAAALLRGLAGLVRHGVGLAGLFALLLLIRRVLLCHGAAPDISRRFFLRVQRC